MHKNKNFNDCYKIYAQYEIIFNKQRWQNIKFFSTIFKVLQKYRNKIDKIHKNNFLKNIKKC